MANIIIAPSKYVQGRGEIQNLAHYVESLGKKAMVIISPSGLNRTREVITNSFSALNYEVSFVTFNGECSMNEIHRLMNEADQFTADVIIGVGGGKIHDAAKATAYYKKLPVAIVPTIASTDAPCSALSVIYTDEGVFEKYLFLPSNPNLVLVDTDIIAAAPARLLVAGMGDALATYFEARATQASHSSTCAGGTVSLAAMELAKLCYNTLIADGPKAALAMHNNVCTKAVENIIETNTYLSGIGFESGGLAGAHAVHNGFTVLPACHGMYHGEKVAFGTLVQLILENVSISELEEVLHFCHTVGLPTTLADLGLSNVSDEEIMRVAVATTVEGESIHNMPFPVDAKLVFAAIKTADTIGHSYKQAH